MADISKITPPGSQTTYNLKDATAREQANWNTNNGVKNCALANTLNNSYGGVPCTQDANDPNIITLIGTNTSGITMYIWGNNVLPVNKHITEPYIIAPAISSTGVNFIVNYTLNDEPVTQNIGANNVIPADSTINYIYVQQTSPNRSINFSVKLMVSPKSIYDISHDYIPYSLPNTKITPELIDLVDSGAKNIFNEPVITTGSAGEINITDNGDGTFTLNTSGATTSNSGVRIGWFTGKQGVTYAVSNYSPSCQLRIRYGSDIILDTSGGANTFVAPSNTKGELIWYVPSGTTLTNYVLKPMICTKSAWDVSQKFVPYRPSYEETVEQVAENENNISTKIGASDYATQNTGGTVRVWTTTSGGETTLHIANEAP